jgi:hypothetical protein
MSMSQPLEPGLPPAGDLPAADPGAGEEPGPPPADSAGAHADPPDDPPSSPRDDVPFRTPDPTHLGPDAGA